MKKLSTAVIMAVCGLGLAGCSHTGTSAANKSEAAQEKSQEIAKKADLALKKQIKISATIPVETFVTKTLGLGDVEHAKDEGKWGKEYYEKVMMIHGGDSYSSVVISDAGIPSVGWIVPSRCGNDLFHLESNSYCGKQFRSYAGQEFEMAMEADIYISNIYKELRGRVFPDKALLRDAIYRIAMKTPSSDFHKITHSVQKIFASNRVTYNFTGHCPKEGLICFITDGYTVTAGPSGIVLMKDGTTWFGDGYLNGEKSDFGVEFSHDLTLSQEKSLSAKTHESVSQWIDAETGAKTEG